MSTPGLGSAPSPNYYKERHEYTVVIELPHNITDVIGDGALVVDVDVTIPDDLDLTLDLFGTEIELEYNNTRMTWTDAEAFCVSKGGHLASVTSPDHWRKLQELIS